MVSPVREGISCSVCGTSIDDGAGRDGHCDDCRDLVTATIEVVAMPDTIESVGHFDFYDYEPTVYDGTYSEE